MIYYRTISFSQHKACHRLWFCGTLFLFTPLRRQTPYIPHKTKARERREVSTPFHAQVSEQERGIPSQCKREYRRKCFPAKRECGLARDKGADRENECGVYYVCADDVADRQCVLLFAIAVRVVTSSGRDVPTATRVSDIILSETPNQERNFASVFNHEPTADHNADSSREKVKNVP